MKFLISFLFAAAIGWSAGFSTGQGARLVIGQGTFTAQEPGVSATLVGSVGGVAYANDVLVVADSNRLGAEPLNRRVLIYKGVSGKLPSPFAELPQGTRCPVCTGEADVVLGQDTFDDDDLQPASPTRMRLPVAVATDGNAVAVADTDNNRVLIWLSLPSVNGQPADVVVGQPDFNTVAANGGQGIRPTNSTLRGPQGVWIQNGRLFVADTGNDRILIWNSIPRGNGQAADLVVGQRDFTTGAPARVTFEPSATPDSLSTPVSVTSDGQRMYVADLGHNRVLIWNAIPGSNGQPADLVIGQPDFEAIRENNSSALCEPIGEDSEGEPTYPRICNRTMEFPRFALSDGRYLFIADSGNDRILVYNQVPTTNAPAADVVLGQINGTLNLVSDAFDPGGRASSGAIPSPMSLAWDGTNLYAADPFNRRILVFTAAEPKIPVTGVRNSASRNVFAVGGIELQGAVDDEDELTITIQDRDYTYTANEGDSLASVILNMVALVNRDAGDPDVFLSPNVARNVIQLTARVGGPDGNNIEYSATVSEGALLIATTAGARLTGGQDAAKIAPGTIVTLFGDDLAEITLGAESDAETLPTELGGVQVYFDGIRAPMLFVSPGEVRAQVPVEVNDAQSISAYVRTLKLDGDISVTNAVAVPIVGQNPGIFAVEGVPDPRPAMAFHGSSFAIGTVSVDGSVRADDVATVVIEDREYSYTVREEDTLVSIRDNLIELIKLDPMVEAFPAGSFTRIRIRARIPGPEGNGIRISARSREDDQVIMTATNATLCCANVEGAPVTQENPALPGETIIVYATGLGLVNPIEARERQITGRAYDGSAFNDPIEFVSSLAGERTANVISAGLRPGTVGIYEVQLELNSGLPTNPATQLTIAQDIYVSNIVTIPVYNPNPSEQ
jgi:hypothetical protein